MADLSFAEPGGAATGSTALWNTESGTWTIDTSIKPLGAYSSLSADLSAQNGAFLRATNVLSGADRFSFYVYFTQVPAARRLLAVIDNALGDISGAVTLNIAGKLEWANGALNNFSASSAVLSPNTFYRVSVGYNNNGGADNLDAKVYLNGIEEISVSAQNTSGVSTITRFGLRVNQVSGSATESGLIFKFAHIYIDDGTDLTDSGNVQVTAKSPTTVNANNFDTTGGTGAVNERPLDEANYKEQAASSQVSQNYSLQARNEGDVNLTSLQVVGYMGWLWGKESAVSGTPKLTVNGTDYAITLTTSPAIYRQPITSPTYPTAAATIGMVSSGSADDTFLYECGIVIVFMAPEQIKLITAAFAGA